MAFEFWSIVFSHSQEEGIDSPRRFEPIPGSHFLGRLLLYA